MTGQSIAPCLWLDDQAEAAADLYLRAFPGSRVLSRSRYPDDADNPSGRPRGSTVTVEVDLRGLRFTLLNGGPLFVPNPSVSFFVHVDVPGDADRVAAVLLEGGQALMPLDAYPWSERYAWVRDRFGFTWQVMAGRRTPGGPAIAPCFMFSDERQGRAEEAMRAWCTVFPESSIDSVERYGVGEGPEGTVKHARFRLLGQEMAAMDAPGTHGFGFNEAISLQVTCADPAGLDRTWEGLVAGGAPGRCGWLKDRFGVSWQVLPEGMSRWFGAGDAAARGRAFAAMMGMGKLDAAAIERAWRGEG